MADRLVAIRKLLTHELQDRRCAAAIVLAELGVTDTRTIKALIATLDDEDSQVRRHVLEALGMIQDESALDHITQRLSDSDPHVQIAAERTLLSFGDVAIPSLEKLLKGAAPVRRRAASILARLQSSTGIESLIEAVDGTDAAVLDRARKALRDQASDLSTTEIRDLRKRLEGRLNNARHARENSQAAALIQLLGDLPDETVVTRIVQEIGPETPSTVRRAALGALMGSLNLSRGRRREAAIEKLLDCLAEEDEDGVTRPALRALETIDLPERFEPRLQELVEAPSAASRAYVLGALGQFGSPDSMQILVDQLINGAAPVRAAARKVLLESPESAVALARSVLNVTEGSRLDDLGDVLHHHRDALPPLEARKLAATAIDRAIAEGDSVRPIVDTVSRAVPAPFLAELHRRVDRCRSKGDLAGAFEVLKAVKDCSAFASEEQYLLALMGLLLNQKSKRPPRVGDRVCAPFAKLLQADLSPSLDGRLRAEEIVQAKDLFYLGFAFSESQDEDQRDFGQELLEEVVERDADGKYGERAKNKLRLSQR